MYLLDRGLALRRSFSRRCRARPVFGDELFQHIEHGVVPSRSLTKPLKVAHPSLHHVEFKTPADEDAGFVVIRSGAHALRPTKFLEQFLLECRP